MASINSQLRDTALFKDLPPEIIDDIASLAQRKEVPAKKNIINEEETMRNFFLIESGEVAIRQVNYMSVVGTLGPGNTFGESSLLQANKSTSQVWTTEPSVLYVFNADKTNSILSSSLGIFKQFHENIITLFKSRIIDTNFRVIKELSSKLDLEQFHNKLAIFMGMIILIITLYAMLLPYGRELMARSDTAVFLNIGILVFLLVIFFGILISKQYKPEKLGLTTQGCSKAAIDNLLFTLPLCLGMIWLKHYFVTGFPEYQHIPLIDFHAVYHGSVYDISIYILILCLFITTSVVQEIIYRCGIQAPCQELITGEKKYTLAICYSSLMFSIMHLHYSYILAGVIFLPSLYFGWLFARSGTVISPIIAHLSLGICAFFILGFQRLLL